MKPTNMEDSTNAIGLDIKISENNTVNPRSRSSSPTAMSSAGGINSKSKASSTSHRSRKEKLVVRSFSTETNQAEDMEPHILTREEFMREKRAKSLGSGPSTPRSSRESSPVEVDNGVDTHESGDGLNGVDKNDVNHNSPPHSEAETDRTNISPPKLKPKPKSHKKKNHKALPPEEKERRRKLRLSKKMKKFVNALTPTSKLAAPKQSKAKATFVKNSSLSLLSAESPKCVASTSGGAGFVPIANRPVVSRKLSAPPPPPPPPAERKLVKYNLLQNRLPKQWFKDFSVTKAKLPSFTVPPPRRPSMASHKKSQPQKTASNKSVPVPDSTNDKNEIRIHCMSNEDHEAITTSGRLNALTLSQGMEKLQGLVKNISPNQLKIEGVTIPQICAEAVAKLVKVASEFPTGTASAGSICSELSESIKNEDLDQEVAEENENEENCESHPFVHHAKNLIRNQGIAKEFKVLMENNQEQAFEANQFHPVFPVGASFMRKAPPTLPRIRVEELEILKELLTPDDHFELAEDEMEMVKLYIELMRAELKAFKEDQKKANMSSMLLNKNPEQDGDSPATGSKIVDAYAIPVKFSSEEERSRIKSALPGLILSQEEVVDKLFNGHSTSHSKDPLKELKTRRLRNGKEVPLQKIRLENVKLKSKDKKESGPEVEPVPKLKSKLALNTVPSFTVPPTQIDTKSNAFITMEPVMTLRDGKELPYDEKGFDIFRSADEPFFKVEVKPELFERELKPWGLDGFNGASGLGSDEYSQKVDANMKRLRDGGKEYEYEYERMSKMIHSSGDYDVGSSKLLSEYTPFLEKERLLLATSTTPSSNSSLLSLASHQSTAATMSRRTDVAVPLPSSSLPASPQYKRKLFSLPPSTTTTTTPCTIASSSIYHPQTPVPYLNNGNKGYYAAGGSGSILSSPQQRQMRAPYSRQQHSSLCPPFENHHCSFTAHYCPFPRAPGSRFCISHVDEGATLQFERCKYFKDSRECGRFIPKADLNSLQVFCELHATIVANARQKKLKTERQKEKSKHKKNILLTQLNNNLDRTKGAIMELNEDGVFSVRKELVEDENETLNDSSGSDTDDEFDNAQTLGDAFGDEDTDVDDVDVDVEGIFPGTSLLNSNSPSDEYDYDCLRHAGHVTVVESVKIYRQKLRQKKQLIGRLMEIEKIKFRHEWRQYCRETGFLKRQRVNFTTDPRSISTSTLRSVHVNMSEEKVERYIQQEMKVYNGTQAVLNHRANRGSRSLLRHQTLRKRQQIFTQSEIKRAKFQSKEEAKICSRPRPTPSLTCSFGSGGGGGEMKCKRTSVPLSRFCPLHIIEDKNQKLMRSCCFKYGPDVDDVCSTPILTHLEEFGCPIHAIPMLPKEVPPTLKENKGPKVEEEIEKVLQEVSDEERAGGVVEEGEVNPYLEYDDDEVENEMEHLVGDEIVDMDHVREVVRSIYGKGVYVTDSEESDDTDEDDEQEPQTAAEGFGDDDGI